jgi:hypothetical protein
VGRLDRAEPVEAVVKRVTAFLLLASACWSVGAAHAQHSTTIKDLRKHFADCFQPPQPLNGSRLTFYFSLTSKGQIIGGGPKTVWFGLRANQSDRARLLANATTALLAECFPVSLNSEMARLIPGDVLFLQFEGTQQGTRVLLGPYGSHVPSDDGSYGRRW